jgi:FkbM family methyltransferase
MIAQYEPRQVVHNYGSLRLTVHLADPLAEGWYDNDWDELPEIALLRQHRLKRGARVFDLGAHQCVVALMLANEVGQTGSVIAVEANPHNAKVGQRNIELNKASQARVVQAAIGEKRGTLIFNEGLNGQMDDGSGSYGRIEVDAVTIDYLSGQFGKPDVLFLDLEGYECRALCGATETLQTKPDCFVEVHVNEGLEKFGGSVESVISFFPTNDYKLFMASEQRREFIPFSIESEITRDRFFLVAINQNQSR